MKQKHKLSIIIPCYNESEGILEVVKKIEKENLMGVSKEIIIIDDGSNQETKAVLETIKNKHRIIYLSRNFGKGHAVREGIKYARGDIILIQDADLEYDPKDYIKLLEPIISGEYKVVYGSRFLNKNNKRSKYYLGVKGLTWLTNLLYSSNITDEATCYKVFKADLLKSIPLNCRGFEFCPEVTAKVLKRKIKIKEIPISYYPRTVGQGKKIKIKDGIIAGFTLVKYKFIK